MQAYRVWVTWVDGIDGFASYPYQKQDRANTLCAQLTASPTEYFLKARTPSKPIKKFDVREEFVPSTIRAKNGELVYSDVVILGDDPNPTQVTKTTGTT